MYGEGHETTQVSEDYLKIKWMKNHKKENNEKYCWRLYYNANLKNNSGDIYSVYFCISWLNQSSKYIVIWVSSDKFIALFCFCFLNENEDKVSSFEKLIGMVVYNETLTWNV